ncbi:Protein of unknown function [Pyronema omphalodes CBS 100304]|uniref:Uncharacterized protein n=1 Tax=Pyronema omphalodes (strain CBS 100304) TaxID=1076935 RepID=U4LIW4_PYROM|nr:Protein of unknown function [Pyronema omphalodes CBS 100304]
MCSGICRRFTAVPGTFQTAIEPVCAALSHCILP